MEQRSKNGNGTMELDSGSYKGNALYFPVESGKGTNPNEFYVAARAGWFSKALSSKLNEANMIQNQKKPAI